MALELAWKADNFGPDAPHIVVKHVGDKVPDWMRGTHGVYVAMDAKGSVRPVGSGRGATLEEATAAARQYNRQLRGSRDN